MKKGLITLLLLIITALPALASPTNTTGPWGVDASGFLSLPIALASTTTANKNVVVSKSTTIGNITTDRAIVINPNVTITITPGTPSITFNGPVTGGKFIIPDGSTVVFDGGWDPGVSGKYSQHFYCSGTGKVFFNFSKNPVGFPEWWGGFSGGTDAGSAINTCIIACPITQLQLADYFTSVRIYQGLPHRKLYGKGYAYSDTVNGVTRILCSANNITIVQVGPDADAATPNDCQQGNELKNVYVGYLNAPLISSACSAVKIKHTLYANIDNVKANRGIFGFMFVGNVYTKVQNCQAVTDIAGAGAGADRWYGFYVFGLGTPIAAGGNASLYIIGCSAACNVAGLQTGDSTGFYLDGKFTDTFLIDPETVNCFVGIQVIGNGPSTTGDWGNLDLHIIHPVMDAFHGFGILLKYTNSDGSIEITNPYLGAASDATFAVYVQDCLGAVNIIGGQWALGVATSITGLLVEDSFGTTMSDTIIMEASNQAVALINGHNCVIKPKIKNYVRVLTNGGVVLTTSDRNVIAPVVYGAAYHINGGGGDPDPTRYVEYGVNLVGTGNVHNEINMTGVSTISLSAPTKKLYYNGAPVTATGLIDGGTNLASGVMN